MKKGIKDVFLWTIIVIACTPLAFILMPFIAMASGLGALVTFVNRLTHPDHTRQMDLAG